MVKITTIYDKVKNLLETDTRYRNSDNALVCRIWQDEVIAMGYRLMDITALQFLMMYSTDKVTNEDSITRARRKVQENFPHLRGDMYNKRQDKETEVINQIKSL